jgi:hypothetical protein
LRARKRIKDGRHVGLDFYDLLIEAFTDSERMTRYSYKAPSQRQLYRFSEPLAMFGRE